MKKILFCIVFISTLSAFASNDFNNVNADEEVVINQNYYVQGKHLPAVIDGNINSNDEKQKIKHLPWSMTEKRIEYDSNGQAQFTPYALNDLNIQY